MPEGGLTLWETITGYPRPRRVLTLMSCACIPEYLTPEQVATILAVSTDTVHRQFGNAEGVIDLGAPETMHKRRKRKLRIPRHTLDRYIQQKQVKTRKSR
jgi:hypothetical protein